jgi:hypothetical protein
VGRTISQAEFGQPVFPKDPDAPLCSCFGLTCDDVEDDIREGSVSRVREHLARARSSEASCQVKAPSGQSCVAAVQRYYMQRRQA